MPVSLAATPIASLGAAAPMLRWSFVGLSLFIVVLLVGVGIPRLPSGRRRGPGRGVGALLLLVGLATAGCRDTTPSSPSNAPGTLSGTVTLLGSDGPPNPAGVRIGLYASRDDLDQRHARYETAMHRRPGVTRTYEYAFESVEPGEYYVLACFDIGCGEYREPGTGTLLTVRVRHARLTSLDFGL